MNGKRMLEIELGNLIGTKCKGGRVYHRSVWNYVNWKYKKGQVEETVNKKNTYIIECFLEKRVKLGVLLCGGDCQAGGVSNLLCNYGLEN